MRMFEKFIVKKLNSVLGFQFSFFFYHSELNSGKNDGNVFDQIAKHNKGNWFCINL